MPTANWRVSTAQSRAFLIGRSAEDSATLAHDRVRQEFAGHFECQAITNSMTTDAVTPESLGALIAAYEHKTYFLAVLMGLNPLINGEELAR